MLIDMKFMKVIYENRVKSLGSNVDEFKSENMFIVFGEQVPDMLKDYCYCIDVLPINGTISAGNKLIIDTIEYSITAVGDIVNTNLSALGHCTFVFNGANVADMPGSIYLENKNMPIININTNIKIIL